MKPFVGLRHAIAAVVGTLTLIVPPLANPARSAPAGLPASYPLDRCIVSGERLGDHGDVVIKEYDGREVRFCCKMCVRDFEADAATYLKKLDQAVIDAQGAVYPIETCVVSGRALGDMGEAFDYIAGNRLVKFCCDSCVGEFEADPAKYLASLDQAVVNAQLADYPADACPISGQKLGSMGEPFDYVSAGRLVRFCCGGCVSQFEADPQTALRKVYGATLSEASGGVDGEHGAHGDHDGHGGNEKPR